MKLELCWFILPLAGILSQIGGTWWKAARRYGIPLSVVGLLTLYLGWDWRYPILALHLFGAYCLPLTLKGDSIPKYLINQLWLPVWGCLVCSPVLWLHFGYWWICLVFGLMLASLIMLSNVKKFAPYFQWKMVEFFTGAVPMIPIMYFITLQP